MTATTTHPSSAELAASQSSPMRIVIIGLTITSSWGNGHATTYRGLVRELARRGHDLLFLERDKPWYAANRDLPTPPYGRTELYESVSELTERFDSDIHGADAVIVGSYVPEGVQVGEWVTRRAGGLTAFYDIDTPVTLAGLAHGEPDYLSRRLIPRYSLYLSFTGGPTLDRLQHEFGSPRARALYCSVDPDLYYPEPTDLRWDLGYLGTYSADRQPTLDALLLDPARRLQQKSFVVAGPLYPDSVAWPANIDRILHLAPAEHRRFYCSQRWTLNVTRADMVRAGYSPSVRLFEAAACGVPIISDAWDGIETLFEPDREIMLAHDAAGVMEILNDRDQSWQSAIGRRARQRILTAHTAGHRAMELEACLLEGLGRKTTPRAAPAMEIS